MNISIDQSDLSETHSYSTDPVESIEYTLTEDTEFLQIEMINRMAVTLRLKKFF